MSVQARSLGSAGRPVFGRPVAAVVAALIATFAIGVPTAVAGETPGPGDPAADVPQTTTTAPVDPPPTDSAPADPPPADLPPADPPADPPSGDTPPADTPPVDPPPADSSPADPPTADPPADNPPPADPPATDPPPADPTGQDEAPADSPPADTPPEQSPSTQPPADPPTGGPQPGDAPAGEAPDQTEPPPGGNHSAAHNQSRVIQAVWQVQRGCRTHCHGTSQTQRSQQVSETNQRATAISGESNGGSSAHALNESSTIQFVWQMQIGCVAFCWHTSQTQEASQQSYTTQEADAQSALTAWAENLAETVQYVFQIQQGCEHECHGVTQHQSSTQGQTTNQSATAEALGDGVGFFLVPDWLLAYAQNIGATIQLIYQYQEALCLEYCMGDAQLQEAIQNAVTNQDAVALANPPVPAEPPPGEEPPGEQPPPGPTTPNVVPEAAAPVAPALARRSSVRQGFVLGRNRRRTVRPQELVLRSGARSTGGGNAAPDGIAAPVPAATGGAPAQGGSTFVPGGADGAAGAAPSARTASDDDKRDVRPASDQLPAQTFAMPSGPNAGGSMGWLLILILTVAVAAVIGSLRRALATTMTRI